MNVYVDKLVDIVDILATYTIFAPVDKKNGLRKLYLGGKIRGQGRYNP
ncbi:MAG: hypothetical protein FWG40_02350 [Peptococcaceae bacterium]|nr:hypothetical protein [Peptococcaceae bacterium]